MERTVNTIKNGWIWSVDAAEAHPHVAVAFIYTFAIISAFRLVF